MSKRHYTVSLKFRESRRRIMLKRWKDRDYVKFWKSASHRRRMSEAKKKDWKDPSYRRKISKAVRAAWKDPKYRAKMKKRIPNIVRVRTSKPQISLFRRICRAGHKGFRLEHRVGRFIIDIAHSRRKIAIEVDGVYWHKLRRKTDRRKDRFLRSLGWKVIRVSEENVRTVSVSF